MSDFSNLAALLNVDSTKGQAFYKTKQGLENLGFIITEVNDQRPWGGYLLINVSQTDKFIKTFFPDIELPDWLKDAYLSPKIMLWAPNEILSWQYHNKRGEYWKVVKGPVKAFLSNTDQQPQTPQIYQEGEIISIPLGIRHRGGGLENWGIIAEIWGHTNRNNLSTEEDIVRLEDRYKRA